ncbi:rhomboid family intramembrane serine protease [Sporobolomyces salmoneus]|uniref:rhomboid family intramembrane serine protease n=1 Tax=Sporobolomyces salmoneus TaxID=183962 RepID=UPI00317C0D43
MALPTAPRVILRLVPGLARQTTASIKPVPFFQSTSSTPRPFPFFYPSQQHLPFAIPRNTFFNSAPVPSPTFTALRAAFHTSSRLPNARLPLVQQRGFQSSSRAHGIRPYYGDMNRGRRPPNWKDRINSIEHVWILGGLIVANALVFCAWQYGQELAVRFRDASWIRFLQRNFTVSWQNITQGRVWCLLTSAFSHEGTSHLVMNMVTLFFMAPPVLAMLGNVGFLSLYLFSGLSASTFSLLFNHYVTQNPQYAAHGASGATYGTIAFFAAAMPRATFLLFFVVPVRAWLCVSGLFAWDFYNATSRRGGMTDSAGHVGGIASGLLFFLRKVGRI